MSENEPSVKSRADPGNEILTGLFFALWCAVGWWSVSFDPELWAEDYGLDPGPGLMPKLVLMVLTAGSLTFLVRGLVGRRAVGARPVTLTARAVYPVLSPVLLAASILVYVAAIFQIGFLAASGAFSLIWMVVLGLKDERRGGVFFWVQTGAGAIIGVALIYFVFVRLIGVPLR